MSLYDTVRDLPLADRALRAGGTGAAGLERLPPQVHGDPPRGRRRGRSRRGRHLRRGRARPAARARDGAPARRRVDDPHVLAAPGDAAALRSRARAARLPRLPALGVRERGARSGSPPGGTAARRGRRPDRAAPHLRRLDAARRARHDRPSARLARPLPHAPLQARRHARLVGRARRRAGRDGRRRLGRLQGPVPRHRRSTPSPIPPSTAASSTASRRRGSRIRR